MYVQAEKSFKNNIKNSPQNALLLQTPQFKKNNMCPGSVEDPVRNWIRIWRNEMETKYLECYCATFLKFDFSP
jgi:hypothetical protein